MIRDLPIGSEQESEVIEKWEQNGPHSQSPSQSLKNLEISSNSVSILFGFWGGCEVFETRGQQENPALMYTSRDCALNPFPIPSSISSIFISCLNLFQTLLEIISHLFYTNTRMECSTSLRSCLRGKCRGSPWNPGSSYDVPWVTGNPARTQKEPYKSLRRAS